MKSMNQKRTKRSIVIDIVGLVLILLILPLFIINLTMTVQTVMDPDAIPNFMGHTPLVHGTESMVPTFDATDLVIVERPEDPAALQEGDIISFMSGSVIVTHRIINVHTDKEGRISYVTKGDANNAPDSGRVYPNQVIGVYEKHYNGLAPFALFLQTTKGLILCCVLPAFLFIAAFSLKDHLEHRRDAKELAQLKAEVAAKEAEQAMKEQAATIDSLYGAGPEAPSC